MATKKRTTRRASGGSANRSSGTKKRGSSRRKGGAVSKARAAFSREAIGIFLLVAGLFFTAAFFTGRGAFLGEAGLAGATRLLGFAGFALPPLAALAGLLVLLGRLPLGRTLGVALLLLAVATTLAAFLPPERRFEPAAYAEAGGLFGSGLYAAVHAAVGSIGAVLALCFLYAVGLSLLTGVALRAAARRIGDGVCSLYHSLSTGARELREKRERGRREREDRVSQVSRATVGPAPQEVDVPIEEPPSEEPTAGPPEGPTAGDEAFEVVLPERREPVGFDEGREQEVVPGEYVPPPLSLLSLGRSDPEHDAEGTSRRLTRALSELGVEAHVVRAVVGPRVTRYELRLGSGVKVGKVRNLQQDIAYALAATEVRILAPIPGKSAVGVEVPNTRPAKVTLGDVFSDYPDANEWSLPVGLGKDISGRAVFFDLAEMPHLLVAGTTGSGKSVMLNGLLTSLLLTTDPRQVKMVLVDPKRVELSQFARVPHLITPVVTDVKKAANALSWAVAEMERRYEVLERTGVRSLDGYNDRAEKQMPYVVIVIDELADLMMTAAAKVEDAVIRLAQKARAVGIHLVVATQRPSVDVITGMIKANVPSRIAFAVSSQIDSRVILDTAGAEALLGQGDMLFKPVSALRPSRVQGAYISESEVDQVVSACIEAGTPAGLDARYVEGVTEAKPGKEETAEPEDDLLPEAANFVVATQQASVSAVQRRFRVGYSRAGRIIDALERKGVVGPYEGSKSRSVVATELDLMHIFGDGEGASDQAGTPPEADRQEAAFDPFDPRGENGRSGRDV
ncbi:MAG: DNA translocase FtsK [uncultured Rubrobacteraceae bacterium]|uniref:DNA translocase FtsK n=1 Tax=uncultured Rubrobacteraceae bacterium TaxID=349277 RepID=A0A6J4PTV5_9ACTN|nr:MAG: DNA translocase FtsK [uncultured Rubrobacteraceae bacterium]